MNCIRSGSKGEHLCKKYGKCYGNYCLSNRECEFFNLKKRVQKIEDYLIKEHNDELDWAIAQFRYTEKDDNQSKAWSIILKELDLRKKCLRSKPCGYTERG